MRTRQSAKGSKHTVDESGAGKGESSIDFFLVIAECSSGSNFRLCFVGTKPIMKHISR